VTLQLVAPSWVSLFQRFRHAAAAHLTPDNAAQAFDLIEELEKRDLFQKMGERKTVPVTSAQSIDDYIASFHSRTSLSLAHMPASDAATFDRQLRDLVSPWSKEGMLELQTVGSVVWGKPRRSR
jgi:Mg/Co/Ni transporter MgtE